MKNIPIGHREVIDLQTQVSKVLRGLGNPEPPLVLDDVRALQQLDRQYYSSTDDGAAREVISKLTIAGKQIVARPTLLLDVIRKAKLSALWLPDRNRILIDSESPTRKQRWYEAHEIGHSLVPWHRDFLYGDSEETLTPICRELLEAEANYTAGQLLFMGDRFTRDSQDVAATITAIRSLAKDYGNTITSTLWRFVEQSQRVQPLVALVTPAPFTEDSYDQQHPGRYCIESAAFKAHFSHVSEEQLVSLVESYAMVRRGGPVGTAEEVLVDARGARHLFQFESFSNRYSFLTLGVYQKPVPTMVAVPVGRSPVGR